MRLKRFIWFLISIGVGAALALAYGWLVKPLHLNNAQPPSLRADYKADYALMVAEVYSQEKSVALAAHRLDLIAGPQELPVNVVQQAIVTANALQYTPGDLALLANLAEALQAWTPPGGSP